MQESNTKPQEGRCLLREAAERQAVKSSMEESMLLQKEAAGLQEAMARAVEGQGPVTFEDPGVRPDPEKAQGLYAAQSGMLLLKVRVFLKTMRELEQKTMLLGKRMEVLQDKLRAAGSERSTSAMGRNPAGDGEASERFGTSAADQAVSERLQSLAVSRALVLQLQAEAGSLAAVYAELESALVEAGRAADQAAQIRLAEAAAEARRTIERAGRTGLD